MKTMSNFNQLNHPQLATESKKLKTEYNNLNTINSNINYNLNNKTPKKTFSSAKKVDRREDVDIVDIGFNNDLPGYAPTEMSMKNTFKSKMLETEFKGEEEQWKELVFKIKLTEPEYKMLLKEKSKVAVKPNKIK